MWAIRLCVLGSLAAQPSDGWWFNSTKPPDPPDSWYSWVRDTLPRTGERVSEHVNLVMDKGRRFVEEWSIDTESWETPRFEFGLWMVIDTLFGFMGWALFGTAWGNVKVGCRRCLQITVVLGLCLIAHYIWSVCYPIVSILVACVMAVVWILRKILKVMGTCGFHFQRLLGGAPRHWNNP